MRLSWWRVNGARWQNKRLAASAPDLGTFGCIAAPDIKFRFVKIVARYNEKTEPPMWGEYGSAAAFYASDEWQAIVQETLAEHRGSIRAAREAGNTEAIAFYERQIKACEQQLGITHAVPAPAQIYFNGKLI